MFTRNVTIVTACNANYLWGVFLLAASIHKEQIPVNMLFYQFGFDADSEQYVSQFPNVEIRRAKIEPRFSLNNVKAEAMLLAQTEYIAWMDADCFVAGWIGDLLIPCNSQLQVRMREPTENATVFDRYYKPEDTRESIPQWVLARWRDDVGDLQVPRHQTTCPSNCIVIHHRYRPFLELWDRQIHKVLNPKVRSAIDRTNPAYWMTDESVFNSVLLFSSKAPAPSEYQLDNLNAGHLVHFIGSPKPWQGWTRRFLYCLPMVFELLEWLDGEGFRLPPIPPSFSQNRAPLSRLETHARSVYTYAKTVTGKAFHKMLGKR